MINFAYELDGAAHYTKAGLQAEGYTVTWRGEARLISEGDESYWTRPIVVERNGTQRPGYISGSDHVIFDRVRVSGAEARTAAQRAAAECCDW